MIKEINSWDLAMNEITTIDKQNLQDKIYTIRGLQVMLDRDLAVLYQVETRALKQAVKRNIDRFPNDFMFELNDEEIDLMVSQSVIPSKKSFGGAKPFVFTEHGVYMLSTVLKSKIATDVSLTIMRTFVRLKNQSVPYFDIIKRLEKLETNDKDTRELLQKVVQVVSNMQNIQDEAKEGIKKIGFV